jgi:hypothetical protein
MKALESSLVKALVMESVLAIRACLEQNLTRITCHVILKLAS